jgi:hypothetical protein
VHLRPHGDLPARERTRSSWRPIDGTETAREFERRLLAAFARQHGDRRPFANLSG